MDAVYPAFVLLLHVLLPFITTLTDSLEHSNSSGVVLPSPTASPHPPHYKFSLSVNSSGLIVHFPLGTPQQLIPMRLDTGSQFSWTPRPTEGRHNSSFNPNTSTSVVVFSCHTTPCTIPVFDEDVFFSCDTSQRCMYDIRYADATSSSGLLLTDKFAERIPFLVGCAVIDDDVGAGIIGMNRGRLSLASQFKSHFPTFSYCVPRHSRNSSEILGSLVLGPIKNKESQRFSYASMVSVEHPGANYNPNAYSVLLSGIKINNVSLPIPKKAFNVSSDGSGQTSIDSASLYSYLVPDVYHPLFARINSTAVLLEDGILRNGVLGMCSSEKNLGLLRNAVERLSFEFIGGAEMEVDADSNLVAADDDANVFCLAIVNSDVTDSPSNILGNRLTMGHTLEFDLANQIVGIGKLGVPCST